MTSVERPICGTHLWNALFFKKIEPKHLAVCPILCNFADKLFVT